MPLLPRCSDPRNKKELWSQPKRDDDAAEAEEIDINKKKKGTTTKTKGDEGNILQLTAGRAIKQQSEI